MNIGVVIADFVFWPNSGFDSCEDVVSVSVASVWFNHLFHSLCEGSRIYYSIGLTASFGKTTRSAGYDISLIDSTDMSVSFHASSRHSHDH